MAAISSVCGQTQIKSSILTGVTGGGMLGAPQPLGPATGSYATGLQMIHQEKYAEAIPYFEHAFAMRPHSAYILNDLGFAHSKLGRYSTAMGFYRQALKEDPDHKGAHENLGELYLDLHDLASAQSQLAELARLCPSGCDERDSLTKSIASYQAANPAPATPAASPATQSSSGG
jgi:tetratricopeptide (TPR) repeat protein